jgi:glycosyltransferase involved in cell wall biosynthesis
MTIHKQDDFKIASQKACTTHSTDDKSNSILAKSVEAQLDQLSNLVDGEAGRDVVKRPVLSVVIPVYNERDSILDIVAAVQQLPIDKQIIIVDDGSTDGTRERLQQFADTPGVEVFLHSVNQGKGAALQSGFYLAEGDIVIVQDADREYSPQEILHVIKPILMKQADVVYGSRYLAGTSRDSKIHQWGNSMLTSLSNIVNGTKLTDMETCYKAFRRDILRSVRIQQRRFGFEPEITAKLARSGIKIVEVPISYSSRSHSEGKKIGIRDLFNAIYCIFRYAWFR